MSFKIICQHCSNIFSHLQLFLLYKNQNKSPMNKTENHFSHYPRSQVDINLYTRLKIAMSLYAGKA
jgi:hypothetical protein